MNTLRSVFAAGVVCMLATGCNDGAATPAEVAPPAPELAVSGPTTPSPLVAVPTPTGALTLWPFTGTDVLGTQSDPINLIFAGQTDLRALRAALMFLDGDRSAFPFPPGYPFDCTWKDAMGNPQTAYTSTSGWSGSAVQLECGDYQPIRFHLRLFDAGSYAIGNVHFETIIPGTTDHQVLNWELAEQLLVADFLRTGLLDGSTPVSLSGPLNPAPYREIPAIIYNGLPSSLRALAMGPAGDVTDPVPLVTDGQATILHLAGAAAVEPEVVRQELTLQFDQVIPKPFCASGPGDYLYVSGPVDLVLTVRITPGGLRSLFRADGVLSLTPVNPAVTPPQPVGETYTARVHQQSATAVTDQQTLASLWVLQTELPPTGPYRGRLVTRIHVGPGSSTFSELTVTCGD